jgi:hypothetical protein
MNKLWKSLANLLPYCILGHLDFAHANLFTFASGKNFSSLSYNKKQPKALTCS